MKAILENLKTQLFGNKYPSVVYKIHREFYTASDKLLKEANEILAKAANAPIKKSNRLESLGFVKAKEVKETKEIIESVDLTKKMSEIIRKYSLKYPNNKFIVEEDVEKICEKYNLVFGNIEDYIGFVPEKNLQEIESFELKEEDYSTIYKTTIGWGDYAHGTLAEIIENWSHRWDEQAIISGIKSGSIVGKKKDKLRICAPLKDFDQEGKSVKGHKLVKKLSPPDPVVLQPVPGGFLIVTAWGNEASDPLVVNHKMN